VACCPEGEQHRARLAIDKELASGACGSGDDAIVDAVVIGEGLDADEAFSPGRSAAVC